MAEVNTNDDIKWLYGKLKSKGYDIGSEQEFTSSLANEDDRKWYYEKAKGMGLDMGGMGDFNSLYAPKAAPAQQPSVVQSGSTTAQSQPVTAEPPADVASEPQQPAGTPLTEQDKIRMSYTMNQMMSDFNRQSKEKIAQINRMAEAHTVDGRKRQRNAEMQARMAGTPVHAGFGVGGDGSPVPYGVTYEDGKAKTQWLMPDGRLTTDMLEAHAAEANARQQRLAHEFTNRMKENGLDPSKPEDVNKQAQLDWEAPMRLVLDDVWAAAEAEDKAADAEYVKQLEKDTKSFTPTPMGPDGMPLQSSSEYLRDINREIKRKETFNLEKMSEQIYKGLPDYYRSKTLEAYTRYFNEHPEELKGREVKKAAEDALKAEVYNAVYQKAVQVNMPKSKSEFLLRKIADLPLLSQNISNSVVASSLTNSWGMNIAEQDAMSQYGQKHKALDIVGTIGNMVLDPTVYISGGVGSIASKEALSLMGKMALKNATKDVAARYAAGTLAGRIAGGIAGGAANFGTFETVKSIEGQMRTGGVVNPETGKPEGFSWGEVLQSTGRGLLLGGATGVLSPVLGNVGDKVVKTTTSTGGKMAVRGGEVAISTLAEGTVFSIPEWIDGERDAFDVWSDNMAMMIGFKASHGIKSAPRMVESLRPVKPTDGRPLTQAERNHNRMNFIERVRKTLDGNSDLSFTAEEREELRKAGYGDLSELFVKKNGTDMVNGSDGEIEVYAEPVEAEREHPEFDGYDAMERLMQDGRVSEAARAKAYYILTGRMLPMSTVTGWNEITDEDGSITIQSVNSRGDVVTSRKFKSKKAAQAEATDIMRQAELNTIDVGERYKEAVADDMVLDAAIAETYLGADPNTVKKIYRDAKNGSENVGAAQRQMADELDAAVERNKAIADDYRPQAIREQLKAETGVDVDEVLRKSPGDRTEQEAEAVKEYARRLFPEQEETARGSEPTPEQNEARNIYDEAKLLYGSLEEGDTDAQADIDAIALRMQEAHQAIEDAFGAETEQYLYQLGEDPWALVGDPTLTEEQQDAVLYYINSKAALDGVMDASNEAAERKRNEIRQTVEKRTNKESGLIVPATMKVDDRPVYIVKGEVVMFPDKSAVDVRNSSESVVLCDEATGEYEFASPEQIFSVGEPIDPQTELSTAEQVIEQEQKAVFSISDEEANVPQMAEIVKDPVEAVNGANEAAAEEILNQVGAGEETALSKIPVNETTGEPIFEAVDKETAWEGLVEASGSERDAADIAMAMIEQTSAELEALKKKAPTMKQPKLKGTPMAMAQAKRAAKEAYEQELEQYNQQLADTKARLDAWNGITSVNIDRQSAERARANAERAEREAREHDAAVARFEEQQSIKAEKQAEQEVIGTHTVNPKIKEKWDNANKIEGNADAVTLPDGSTIRGHYVLTEAGSASASHDVNNAYEPTEGFPIDENGQSVNDRDYKRDMDAQRIVRDMADAYDNRALQTPVIVSKDGVVLSGNNRTMSGDLAARQGTDKAYTDYLKEFGTKYGFAPEVVEGFSNPRIVFVPDEELPYDATTFSRFNAQEMKSQSKPEAAVKLGKVVPDHVFNDIVGDISRYDRLSDYYADENAVAHALGALMQACVINDKQMPELRTGTALSAAGKELIENTLIGKVFQSNPDAVRQIISLPGMRQGIVMGLSEIASNRTLSGKGYDLSDELAKAVDLVQRAKAAMPDVYRDGMPVSPFGRMQGLFDDEFGDRRVTDGVTLLLADLLNSGKPGDLRKVLATYNGEASQSAAGQVDMFSGTIASKEDILTPIIEHFRNATPREQQALVDAAIAERKRRAEEAAAEQGGRGETSEQVENAVQRSAELQPVTEETSEDADLTTEEAALQARVEITDNDWAEGDGVHPTYKREIIIDGKHKVTQVDAPDAKGNYYGPFFEYDGKRFGWLGDVVDYIDGEPEESTLGGMISAAEENVNTAPTEAQKEAGNYKKGHVRIGQFDITIENPKGSVRSGRDADGKEWSVTMNHTYGYIRGTQGVDGDHIDVYASSDINGWDGRKVFVIDQYNPDGTFDEHKVMLGFNDRDEAYNAYLSNYEKDWDKGRRIEISTANIEDFEKWIDSSKRKTKPFAEYKGVKIEENNTNLGSHSFTAQEANDFITRMEANADIAPKIELTIENWDKLFGEDGNVETPIGHVKMGENQFAKMMRKGRDSKLGLVKPTLENPNVIIEDRSGAEIGDIEERPSSYIFVKSFKKADGLRFYHFTSITVSKAGKEVVISNQEKSRNRILRLLQEGNVIWRTPKDASVPSAKEQGLDYEQPNEAEIATKDSGITPQITPSADKGNTNLSNTQESGTESYELYTITPTTYTNKSGKKTPMHEVKFSRDLSYDERKALASFARENVDGKSSSKGWCTDKDNFSTWIFRSEEDARKAGALIADETGEAVADAQPLSVEDLSVISNQLSEKPAEPKKAPAKSRKSPANRVSVEDVFADLNTKGETTLSDHGEPATHEKPRQETSHEISDDEMQSLANELRDLLGIGEDDGDIGMKFREPGELTPQERQKIQAAGVRLAMGLVERGTTAFPDYATKMVALLGDKIRPWLKSFYEAARWTPGYEEYAFTPSSDVATFDVQNFDKQQADPITQAEMIVEERKAAAVSEQAQKELTELRNENRRKEDEQTAADTAALEEEAEAVASKAEALAETSADEQELNRAIEQVDESLEKVNEQLALLGYYEADEDEGKFHESYGYMLTAEKKALKDATNLAKQLVEDLGLDIDKVSSTPTLSKSKKQTAVTANIAPAGGDMSIRLPLNEGRELYVNISLDPVAERGTLKRGDNLQVGGIMYRVENPSAGGWEHYGRNCWADTNTTYADLLSGIERESYKYLPEREQKDGEYHTGDEVMYSPNGGRQWVKAKVVNVEDGNIRLDTGLAPVMYANATPDQVKRPAEEAKTPAKQMQEWADMAERGESPYTVTPEVEAELAKQRDAEDIFAEAQRVAKEAQEKKRSVTPKNATETILDIANPSRAKKSNKKPKQEQRVADLFGDLFSEQPIISNEKETNVQPRTGVAERAGGHELRQNEPLGESQRHETERTDGRGMGGRDNEHPVSDRERSVGVSRQPKSERKPLERLAEGERKNTHNNHAERGTDHAPKGEDARIKSNIEAIETAKRLLASGEAATPEDMSVLRKFSGWGGLGKAFEGHSTYKGRPTYEYLIKLLGEDGYQDAVDSRRSAYYTPAEVIDAMWDIAKAMGFTGGNVLEGSAGIGNILGLMPVEMSDRSTIHAVEKDSTTGGIMSLLYPDAKVDVQGFEETKIPNNSIDLAITNVPFVTGLKVFDTTGDKDLSKKFKDIHDFCIAKNIRKLKEGGIGIFISSSGTMDNSANLRRWITSEGNADVVGAFRMHNKTFGGTGATSDIIVVRKRVNGKQSANAIDVAGVTGVRVADYDTGETRKIKGQEIPIVKSLSMEFNKYFAEHPENMAGEMRFGFEEGDTFRPQSKALYPTTDKDQGKMLADWVKRMAETDWEVERSSDDAVVTAVEKVNERLGEGVKEGSMVLNSKGELCMARIGEAVPIMSPQAEKGKPQRTDEERLAMFQNKKVKGHTKAECFKAYSAIKKALADVLEYQSTHEDNDGLEPLLKKLNNAFDTFTRTYGNLHKNPAISFLRNDVDFSSIQALETYSEKGDKKGNKVVKVGKTDIFSRRVIDTEKEPQPKTIKDGILASLYKNGGIDPMYIADALGKTVEDVKREIVESGLGFENPANGLMEVSYRYLSGNVREKLHIAQESNADGRYDANVKALEKVIPMNIPAHLIEFTLGSSWIDPKLYEDFVKEKTGLDVKLANVGGTWFMDTPDYTFNEKNRAMAVTSKMCDKTIMGHELIDAAITNKPITVSKTTKKWDGTTETITDKTATAECSTKIDEIRAEFKDWAREHMQSDAALAERIEQTFNEQFNNYVPMTIPEEFVPKHFGGQVSELHGRPFALRPHQGKAVVRGTTEPVLLAHEVGTGKTYTLITTAMEMRRLGTAKKPMIVVQNATVGQFVESAKEIYPNAKVLTIEEADRTADGRKNFYAKIKYNDWDMIVVPQSVFERIPDSEEIEMAYIKDIIEEKMKVLEAMRNADGNGKSMIVRNAEKEIEKEQERLAELTEAIAAKRKVRDEKKESTARENAEVRAMEMLDREVDDVENFDDMGIDALLVDEAHEYKHLGFATAMQRGVKGVDPSYSKKSQGVFLKSQAVMQKNNGRNVVFATGTPISNTAAEIWTFMRYLMPADTMKAYGIYYFDDFVRNFGNISQMVEFTTNGKFKENNRFAGYVNLPELVRIWSNVADTVLTREAGGVSDKIPDMEGGKATDTYLPQTRALRSVMKYVKDELQRYEDMNGKEKKENSHIPLTMYGIAKAAAVDARLVVDNTEDDPNSKTNATVREVLRSLADSNKYKGTVAIFADNYQNKRSGFNLYEDIRNKLIGEGVPAEQIVIIKPGMTVKKKLDIFDKVNAGDIRVIMGSTFTLGTGVNIQERLHTAIHIDAPNRPMDYTQRNGRILRQGNLHKDMGIPVRIIRFGVEDSLDVTAYQRLKTKGAIADSIMNGSKMMQNAMDNRVLEEEEDVFGDMTAQLSGSEYAILKNQAEREVRNLSAKQKGHDIDQVYVHNQIPVVEGYIKGAEWRIDTETRNLETLNKHFPDGTFKQITIGKRRFESVEAMENFFKEQNTRMNDIAKQVEEGAEGATSALTVDIDGLPFTITTKVDCKVSNRQGGLFSEAERSVTYSCEALGIKDVQPKGNRIKNAIQEITENIVTGTQSRGLLKRGEDQLARYTEEKKELEKRAGKEFPFKQQLADAKARLAEYEEAMKKELAEKEAKYAEMDKSVEAATDVTYTEEDDEESTGNTKFSDSDIDEANDWFNEQLKLYENGELGVGGYIEAGRPMGVMRRFMPDLPLILRQRVAGKARKKHELTIDEMRNLPGALAYPIFVFKRDGESIGVLTVLRSVKGENLFVAVDLGVNKQMGNRFLDINDIVSVHGREAENIIYPIVENGTLQYVDKEKGLQWLSSAELNPQAIASEILDSAAKVIKIFENPAFDNKKSDMEDRVSELSEKLNTPVRVVSDTKDVEDLPSTRHRRAKGFYDQNTGEIVVVLPNNADVADVENTVVHEVVGHRGLRALVGAERMDEFVNEVYSHASDRIRKSIDKATDQRVNAEADRLRVRRSMERERNGEDVNTNYYTDMAEARVEAEQKREQYRRDATEEYMSDMAGRIGDEGFEKMSQDEQTLWGRIKAKVQQFLDKFLRGLKIAKSIRLTDKDIAYILFKSWKNMRDGGVFAQAEDAVMRRKTGYDADDVTKFRDGGLGLEEAITNIKAEAAAANADNLQAKRDAMRAIGGNLNHLRSAMARQREYDLTTVKSVTDLAKVLLDNNLLDDLSKYETKRILGTVNSVVGKQNVSQYVQKVMDIMVDNQLRMGSNTFGRLLSIKGSRVDARGIEVQGELDPDGQRIAQVVKKSVSLPKDDIDNRIAEALNRMGSSDQAIADEAALEYAGLQISHQYVEDITESKAEEKELRESLKQAKEDKDADTMTDAAYKQYVEATNDAIRQNKIERAEAYNDLVRQMSGVLGESVQRAKVWRDAERQRVEDIQHNANSDIEGRPTDEHHKEGKVQAFANNSGVRFLLAPLGTFDQMLRMFGSKNVRGEGYLWNRYMRGWVDATEKEYTGYRDALKVLDDKVSEVYGKKMSWGDLFAIDRKLPKATVNFWDGGEYKDHELTQGNLLYIYMADKMSDGRMKLRRMGITEEDVEDIKNFIDPKFLELADWMQEEFLVDKRNEYNEVHKRMFGASMAAIENYFPLKILSNARLENVDIADDTTDTALPSTSTGSIIKRRRNSLALDVTGANAFSVILGHIQQMERWASFAEFNRDLNTLLSYKRFRNQVMNMTSAYGAGKTLWNNFRNVCSMAAGAYRPPIAALDKAAVNIAKGVTAAKVSFRVFTALKQFLSMPAYLSDSNPMYLARNIVNPYGAWKWSMNNMPIFEKRWKSRMAGDPRLMKTEMDWKAWRSNIVQIASRIGMSPNAFVDALTVAIGTHAMYETRLKKYLRQGYEPEAAEKRAKQDATILFNQTQQSSEGAFLSTMQVDRSWLSVLFTVFRNSSMSYTRQLYDAVRNIRRMATPGYKGISEEFMAKQMRRDGIDPDKADANARKEYRRAILRDFVRVGVFGYALQMAWNLGAYIPYLLLGEDEDEKSKLWDDVFNHTMFGSIEGLTGGDVMSAAGQMWMNGNGNWSYLVKDMPLASDISSILRKFPKDEAAAMNDVTNLLVQSGIGVNPQSLTDAVVAIIDACGGDAETSRECALLITRIINCPPSQIDKIYFDELDMSGEEASKMTPAEIAERYADYKVMREAPMTGWLRSEEVADSIRGAKEKKAINAAKEKIGKATSTDAIRMLLQEYDEVTKRETAINKLKKTDRDGYRNGRKELRETTDLRRHNRVKRYKRDMKELTEKYLRAGTTAERDEIVEQMFRTRDKMLEDMNMQVQQ